MGYEIAVLLGNARTFCKAYFIAARNGGGLKRSHRVQQSHYIAAGNGGGLKPTRYDKRGAKYYIAARKGGG